MDMNSIHKIIDDVKEIIKEKEDKKDGNWFMGYRKGYTDALSDIQLVMINIRPDKLSWWKDITM